MKPFLTLLFFCWSLAGFAAPAHADDHAALLKLVENHVLGQLQNQGGQVSVRAGPLDPRMRLPACSSYQAFTPNGARLQGNTSIGLRCNAPGRWSIFVPVRISILGNYVTTAAPLTTGQVLQATDLTVQSGDLGALPAGIITDPAQAIGKTVRFSLPAGQPLRQDQLTAPLVIQQGQSVQLVFHGPGFTATNEGKALNNASEGQIIQVRTPSGLIVSGMAQADGTVRVGQSSP
ncbi:MAG: flagellar basal body P-ring formation chaperone FlgA [Azovibrio sp.]|uniref:flagellar basal body P-ring formation chaperone FlgA n=1 Tax=Azovibrio sp. TaxID=1872673 RepID=UPI003C76352A